MKTQTDLMKEQAEINRRIEAERENARLAALQAEVEAAKPKRRKRKATTEGDEDAE